MPIRILRSALFYGLWVFAFSCIARQLPNFLHLAVFAYAYKVSFLVLISAFEAFGAVVGGGIGFLLIRKFKHHQWHLALLGIAHVSLLSGITFGVRLLPQSTQYSIGNVLPRGQNQLIFISVVVGLVVVAIIARLIRARDDA
jgi:hypothetical protein